MVTPLFGKLNLKDEAVVLVLDSPPEFEPEVRRLEAVGGVEIVRELPDGAPLAFALLFARSVAEVDDLARRIGPLLTDDAKLWFAYPKRSSRRYSADISRDAGWEALAGAGFEPVRQVSIDADWSALRFRRVERIARMTRSFARTEEGKRRVEAGRED